jgi:serine/threonine-protein kinase HipA
MTKELIALLDGKQVGRVSRDARSPGDCHRHRRSRLQLANCRHRRVRLAPLYDIASSLPYDGFDMRKVKFAMKIGGEYKLSQIGLRQWLKFAREVRVEPDELIARLAGMAEQLPDEVNTARLRAREQGLDAPIIERLTAKLIERAGECERRLRA